MGTLIQRKAFDHVDFAEATADGFHEPRFAIPGLKISTDIVEQDGQIWLVLTQSGAMVTNTEALLPGWELVSFQP